MSKHQVKQSGEKLKSKCVIHGKLNYITEYKKLVVKCENNSRTNAIISNLDKANGRKPYKLSEDGFFYLTLTPSKYEKSNVYMRKYEKMLKKKVVVHTTASTYDSAEYGAGVYLLVDNIRLDMTENAESDSGSHTEIDEVVE